MRVAIFTDNDFDKVNGVTTTLKAVLAHTPADMQVQVFTAAEVDVDTAAYRAVGSWGVGLPWYREMRIYWPRWRTFARALRQARPDVVHITTPGPIGLMARRLAA